MTNEVEVPIPRSLLKDFDVPGALAEAAERADSAPGRPPVHLWNPPDCGQISIEIRRDGSWWHDGTPIRRKRLVNLFASILRREGERYYLVTPVEKFQIRVEDAPFIAVEMRAHGSGRDQELAFRTEQNDFVIADSAHPIRVVTDPETGEPSPYVMVRDRLEARINRPVFYDLVNLGAEVDRAGHVEFGVWSGGCFFTLGRL